MIFITLGSQKFQFNRLLKTIDSLIEEGIITDKVFAQTGYSDYLPHHYEYQAFLDRETFKSMGSQCDILITHGGTGAIIGGVKNGKKVIAVPRLAKYGEHVDDHQKQIIEQFKEQDLIYGCEDCSEIAYALSFVQTHKFLAYKSNTQMIINNIERFIEQ